mmetsp:Transcript_503/g.1524  ORF Transcript_503/g.1524 Transcript_503/m.1524 type:complete len:195 (-) Transcript_503:77-661(-)
MTTENTTNASSTFENAVNFVKDLTEKAPSSATSTQDEEPRNNEPVDSPPCNATKDKSMGPGQHAAGGVPYGSTEEYVETLEALTKGKTNVPYEKDKDYSKAKENPAPEVPVKPTGIFDSVSNYASELAERVKGTVPSPGTQDSRKESGEAAEGKGTEGNDAGASTAGGVAFESTADYARDLARRTEGTTNEPAN